MGRIKTMLVKRTTQELMEKHADQFTDNFEENKKAVGQLLSKSSKKIKNTIAGYATRLIKRQKAEA
jgi:small subunit ribosomal protein S17e